jgi:hypothetical protein
MSRSRILVVLASMTLLLAALAGYADRALFDPDQFANRATDALRDQRVRDVVATEITDDLVLRADADLLAARPLIQSVASGVVGSDAFTAIFHAGVRDLHRAIFERDRDTATLTLVDAATIVRGALRALRPALADEIDADSRVRLIESDIGAVTGELARLGERVRLLAPLLFAAALLLAAGALAVAADRRRAATDLGVGIAVVGVVVVVLYALGRGVVLGRVGDPSERDAAAAVWDSFLGDLRSAGWVLAVSGAVVAAAAASLIRPVEIDEPLRRIGRAVVREPEAGWARLARALGLVVLGLVVIIEREVVLQLAFTLVGAYLVYSGIVVLLRLVYRPPAEPRAAGRGTGVGRRLAVAAVAVLAVAGSVTAFAAGGGTSAPAPESVDTCNGSVELCSRPLAQVVLPATHNSMSAPLPGWFSSEHLEPIPGQLQAGVRGLLIDTHYGDRLANGRVRTDFGAREDLAKAVKQDGVSPSAIEAANRVRARIGFGGKGVRGMYLCHTFCEIGATPLDEALGWIAEFAVAHPGEVLVVVNQDYLEPADFVAAVEKAGLADLAYGGPVTASRPTLREMIDSGRRIVFLAENEAGAAPWYRLAYEALVEETPYTFKPGVLNDRTRVDATCRPNRGPAEGAPLFLMNHWVSTDPTPRPSDAVKVNARDALLRRVRACAEVRGRLPSLIAVNFSEKGDVFGVVDALNADPPRYTPD